jgi:hypothetical protein
VVFAEAKTFFASVLTGTGGPLKSGITPEWQCLRALLDRGFLFDWRTASATRSKDKLFDNSVVTSEIFLPAQDCA